MISALKAIGAFLLRNMIVTAILVYAVVSLVLWFTVTTVKLEPDSEDIRFFLDFFSPLAFIIPLFIPLVYRRAKWGFSGWIVLLLIIMLPLMFCNWVVQGMLFHGAVCEQVDQQNTVKIYYCTFPLYDFAYFAKDTTTGDVYSIVPAEGTYTDMCTRNLLKGMPRC